MVRSRRRRRRRPSLEFLCLMQAQPLSRPRLPSARELGRWRSLARLWEGGCPGDCARRGGGTVRTRGRFHVDCRRTSVAASTASTGQRRAPHHASTPVPWPDRPNCPPPDTDDRKPAVVRPLPEMYDHWVVSDFQEPAPGPQPSGHRRKQSLLQPPNVGHVPQTWRASAADMYALDRAPQTPTLPFLSRPSPRSATTTTPPPKPPWSGGQSHTRTCTTAWQHRLRGAVPRRSAGGKGTMPRGMLWPYPTPRPTFPRGTSTATSLRTSCWRRASRNTRMFRLYLHTPPVADTGPVSTMTSWP